MKNIRWLLTLADGKPLLFSLAILLIATSTLSVVVVNRDKKIDRCNEQQNYMRLTYDRKIDSIVNHYEHKEMQLNQKVENTLNSIIEDYKEQLDIQRAINQKVTSTLKKNRKIINKTKTQNYQQ